jgi:hypothetical protein
MQERHIIAAALAAAALTAVGCGGSSKSSSQTLSAAATSVTQTQVSAGPRLTATELIAKADPICARVNAIRASNKIRSRQDFTRVVTELASEEQHAVEGLNKLVPPTSLAGAWSRMLNGYRAIASNLAQVSRDAAANNFPAANSLVVVTTALHRQTAAIARSAGFKDCARSI